MNIRTYSLISTVTAVLVSGLFCPPAEAKLFDLTPDGSGAFNITAEKLDVLIGGTNVHALVYRDRSLGAPVPLPADGIPVLVMKITAGQMVTCNFTNLVPDAEDEEGCSIHWHGIELDNDSDGTAVTQDSVKEGQRYTYRFIAPRPGIFWFHSHMVPGDTLWAGMYGVLIVQSPCEPSLANGSVLPNAQSTRILAMSDIEWDDRAMTNSVVNPALGHVGRYNAAGVFQTINEWIKTCAGGASCRTASDPGKTVLVNGYNPATATNAGGPLTMQVQTGQVVRLQLLNEALTRSFCLSFEPTNTQLLVRIGGQGGLLNNARLEGGNPNDFGWNTFYDRGMILLSSGMRADVVTTIPTSATNGQRITLWGEPLLQVNAPWPLMSTVLTHYPIAYFDLVAGAPANNPPPLTHGTAILAGRGCGEIINQTNGAANIKTNFMDPPAGLPGTNSGIIQLTTRAGKPSIDDLNISATNALDGNLGNGEVWAKMPHLSTDRYAHIGELYILTITNATGTPAPNGSSTLAHPFHLHGWSMQPLSMIDGAGTHAFPYNEFLDTIEVYGGQRYVFSVKLDDHPAICDQSSGAPPFPGPILGPCTGGATGGALGHWLYHCHIANHGVLGMMGQIILIDDAPQRTNWVQLPNLTTNGVDVLATAGTGSQTVADDFQWTNGPVTGVTVWGSWTNDAVDPNATFELKFWTDVPAFNAIPSRPGWQAWRQLFAAGTYSSTLVASNIMYEGFYDPSRPNFAVQGDTKVFRYDFNIPQAQAFLPRPGYTNWLSVTAYANCPCTLFGWKTCVTNSDWNDDASWSSSLWGPPWTDLHYPVSPYAPRSMNMAFQLSTPIGGTNSSSIVSAPAPTLSASMAGGSLNISWAGGGVLQYADEITGPWNDIEGATSPYQAPTTAPQRFYRVRLP